MCQRNENVSEELKSPYLRQQIPAGWENVIGLLISLILLVDNCQYDSMFRVQVLYPMNLIQNEAKQNPSKPQLCYNFETLEMKIGKTHFDEINSAKNNFTQAI